MKSVLLCVCLVLVGCGERNYYTYNVAAPDGKMTMVVECREMYYCHKLAAIACYPGFVKITAPYTEDRSGYTRMEWRCILPE